MVLCLCFGMCKRNRVWLHGLIWFPWKFLIKWILRNTYFRLSISTWTATGTQISPLSREFYVPVKLSTFRGLRKDTSLKVYVYLQKQKKTLSKDICYSYLHSLLFHGILLQEYTNLHFKEVKNIILYALKNWCLYHLKILSVYYVSINMGVHWLFLNWMS